MEALRAVSRLLRGPAPWSGPAPGLGPGPAPESGPAPWSGPAPSGPAPWFGPAPWSGPAPRPFWVGPAGGEGRPRGVLAATLAELRQQAGSDLGLPSPPVLALAEDGTLVEDEEFFGTLPPHTALTALGEGQRWEPPTSPPLWALGPAEGAPRRPPRELRLELGGLGPRSLLRELLRLLASLSGALGRALLGVSAALRPLLEGPQTRGEGL